MRKSYIITYIPSWSHASKSSVRVRMFSRAWVSTRLVAMSQSPRTGSRHLAVDYSQPSTYKSRSKLGDSSRSTGADPEVTRGGADDHVPYDWRTFTGDAQLRYIVTEGTANECIARIASRPSPVTIGLDTEWRPTFAPGRPENPIALVQLACDDEILLVQVSAMEGTIYMSLDLVCPRICWLLIQLY